MSSEACTCPLGADECVDGETGVFHPLQDGGMCSTRSCQRPKERRFVGYAEIDGMPFPVYEEQKR
jgi:hypothetical protein